METGRKPQPTAAAIDSQSVKAAEEVARASRPRPLDLLLDGFALLIAEGHAAAAPTLQRAVLAVANIPATISLALLTLTGLKVLGVLQWAW